MEIKKAGWLLSFVLKWYFNLIDCIDNYFFNFFFIRNFVSTSCQVDKWLEKYLTIVCNPHSAGGPRTFSPWIFLVGLKNIQLLGGGT